MLAESERQPPVALASPLPTFSFSFSFSFPLPTLSFACFRYSD